MAHTEMRTLQLPLPTGHPAPFPVDHVTWAFIRRYVVGAAVGAAGNRNVLREC